MRRTAAASLSASVVLSLLPGLGWAQSPEGPLPAGGRARSAPVAVEAAPAPRQLLAQANLDNELRDEETLEDLIELEVNAKAQSVGAAVALSFIPGGGWGLLYAGRKAQAVVPFVLSAVGYGVGFAYLAGSFDTSSSTVCSHTRDGVVPSLECGLGDDPVRNKDVDPRSTANEPFNKYLNTKAEYGFLTTGEDFDGSQTGVLIIAATYGVTTLLGAAWAGSSVAADNDRLRRDAESTASLPRPYIGHNGERGVVGVTFDF